MTALEEDDEDGWSYWSRVYSDPELRVSNAFEDESISEVLYGQKLQRTKVIIENLPSRCSEEEIKNFLEADLGTAKVMRVNCSGRKSFRLRATVEFYLASDAAAAVDRFNGYRFRNCRLKVTGCEELYTNENSEKEEQPIPVHPVNRQEEQNIENSANDSFVIVDNPEEGLAVNEEGESHPDEPCPTSSSAAVDDENLLLARRNLLQFWNSPLLPASSSFDFGPNRWEKDDDDDENLNNDDINTTCPFENLLLSVERTNDKLNVSRDDNEEEEINKYNHAEFFSALKDFVRTEGPMDYSDYRIKNFLTDKASSSVSAAYLTWLLGAFRTRKQLTLVGKFLCIPEDVTLATSLCTTLNETSVCKESWESLAPSQIMTMEELATYFTSFLEFFGPMWIYDLPFKYLLYSLPSSMNMSPTQLERELKPFLPNLLLLEDTFYLTTITSISSDFHMSYLKDLPAGRHEVKLGKSLVKSANNSTSTGDSHHTVRYDFKPASVGEGCESYIDLGKNNAATVVVPKIDQSSNEVTDVTVFRGAKKQNSKEKECLLLYNHESGEFHLEKLASQIQVKKTRNDEKTKAILEIIKKKRKKQKSAECENMEEEDDEGDISSSDEESSSTNSEGSEDEDNGSENSRNEIAPKKPVTKPVSQLHEDLRLSDSSDD